MTRHNLRLRKSVTSWINSHFLSAHFRRKRSRSGKFFCTVDAVRVIGGGVVKIAPDPIGAFHHAQRGPIGGIQVGGGLHLIV